MLKSQRQTKSSTVKRRPKQTVLQRQSINQSYLRLLYAIDTPQQLKTCMSLHDMRKVFIKQVSNNRLTVKKILKYICIKDIHVYILNYQYICSSGALSSFIHPHLDSGAAAEYSL